MTEAAPPRDDASEDEWVILAKFFDGLRAKLARTALEGEGIAVDLSGLEARETMTVLNGGATIELVMRVHTQDFERAKALLAVLEEEGELVLDDDAAPEAHVLAADARAAKLRPPGGPYRTNPSDDVLRTDYRSWKVAVGVSLFVGMGAGHWYAREKTTALALTMSSALAWAMALGRYPPALVWAVCLHLFDVVDGFYAVGRYNEQRVPSFSAQTIKVAIVVPAALLVSVFVLAPLLAQLPEQ